MYIYICICITFFALTLCYTSFFFFLLYIVFIHVIVHVRILNAEKMCEILQKHEDFRDEKNKAYLIHGINRPFTYFSSKVSPGIESN